MESANVSARLDTTPYQVLSMNIDPALQTIKGVGERNLGMRNWRLQNATEFAQKQALQSSEIQGNKDIAQWHERVANIREDTMNTVWDKRIQAQASAASAAEKKRIESLSQIELDREARTYATGQMDQRTGLYIPPIPRLANEATSDYVTRAATERAKSDAQREGLIQKNTTLLSGRISKLVQDNDAQNEATAHTAGIGGVNEFLARLGAGPQQKFKSAVQKLVASGVPYPHALEQVEQLNPAFAGVTDAYAEKAQNTLTGVRTLRNPILQTQVESLGSLLKNPAALSRSDFGDLLDEHPSAQAPKQFTLSPAGTVASLPAPVPVPQGNTIALTGIPGLDRQVQAEQTQAKINDLTKTRASLMTRILGLHDQVNTAVDNRNITIPSYGGGMGAVMPQSMPAYSDATSRAKAVLSFQSQSAPLQQQLDDVNQQIGGEFQ